MLRRASLPNANNDTWTCCSPSTSGSASGYSEADSFHSGGINVLMADGSVKFIKNTIIYRVWWAIGTRAGNETFRSDSL